MGLPTLAAVGLFDGGFAIGRSDCCGLRGFFVNCQDLSKANAENVGCLVDVLNYLVGYFTQFLINTDEKFFPVEIYLAALNGMQFEMAATQD